MRRRSLAALLAGAVLAALAGCGTPAADLFVVSRSGSIPGARLTLLVSDDGTARCNSGPRQELGDPLLLRARDLARRANEDAKRDLTLPPGPNSILAYRVRLQDGTVRFHDNSPRAPAELLELAAFTREVATRVCGLPR